MFMQLVERQEWSIDMSYCPSKLCRCRFRVDQIGLCLSGLATMTMTPVPTGNATTDNRHRVTQ